MGRHVDHPCGGGKFRHGRLEHYPWGRLDYICNSKTNKSVSVSVILGKLIRKQLKSVSVISGVQV